MIDPNAKFTVIKSDNGAFLNVTNAAADFTRDNFLFTMVAAEDYIYVGLDKPFNALYVEFVTPNINPADLTVEVYNGSSWVTASPDDETNGFTRSGFIFFDKSAMLKTSVNANERYYVRLVPSVDTTAMSFRGINMIFADDSDMVSEFPEILNSNLLPAGQTSHILTHVASRNHILHNLRNHYSKAGVNDSALKKINQFDLIDVLEVREAAMFLALSKIFFNLSDAPDDNWWTKYKEYADKFEEKMTLARLSIDENNDGVDDAGEVQQQFQPTRWAR
jgi:hypothetical protein